MEMEKSNILCPSCGEMPETWESVVYESVLICKEEGGLDIGNWENMPHECGYICPLCGAKHTYDELEEQTI